MIRQRFNLYIRPNASPALQEAHRRYVAAMEASWSAEGEDIPAAWDRVNSARRRYGVVMLREDKAARPHAY